MPVTQARLIAILDAADDILQKYKALSEAVRNARAMPDADAAMGRCWDATEYTMPSIETISTIASELRHFSQQRQHKNNRDAARRRASRGQSRPGDDAFIGTALTGLQPRYSTPTPGFREAMGFPDEPISPPVRTSEIPTIHVPSDIAAAVDADLSRAASDHPAAPISPRAPTPGGEEFITDPAYDDPNAPD